MPAGKRRLSWLEKGTQWAREGEDEEGQDEYAQVGFTPQPYQQLADVYRHHSDRRADDQRADRHNDVARNGD